MGPPPALGSKTLSILSLLCVASSLPCLERKNPSKSVFAKAASYKKPDLCCGVTSASLRPGPSPGVPPRSRGRRPWRGPTQRHPSWSRTDATLLHPSSSPYCVPSLSYPLVDARTRSAVGCQHTVSTLRVCAKLQSS